MQKVINTVNEPTVLQNTEMTFNSFRTFLSGTYMDRK